VCHSCDTTHVLLPALCVPRRREGATGGTPPDRCPPDRPPATVRGRLRAAARRSEPHRLLPIVLHSNRRVLFGAPGFIGGFAQRLRERDRPAVKAWGRQRGPAAQANRHLDAQTTRRVAHRIAF